MTRPAIACIVAGLAAFGVGAPSSDTPVEDECPKGGGEVVVKALRFSEGPPAYSFMVTNNGARPIWNLSLGTLEDTFIEAQFETVPTNVGSPGKWEGTHVFAQDPRMPEAHSHSLIAYYWTAAEHPDAWIRPGKSLAGFSVQFPMPKRHPPGDERRRPAHPDLTNTPFLVDPYGARCPIVGVVEPDGVGLPATGADAPQSPAGDSQRDADTVTNEP